MQEKIIEAIFNCYDKDYSQEEKAAINTVVDSLAEKFDATGKDRRFIESKITEIICIFEKSGFFAGYNMCSNIMSGFINAKECT